MKQIRQTIAAASEHHFEIFGAPACSVRLTLICGHTEIRKLSAIKGYVVNRTKLKCRDCTLVANGSVIASEQPTKGVA